MVLALVADAEPGDHALTRLAETDGKSQDRGAIRKRLRVDTQNVRDGKGDCGINGLGRCLL